VSNSSFLRAGLQRISEPPVSVDSAPGGGPNVKKLPKLPKLPKMLTRVKYLHQFRSEQSLRPSAVIEPPSRTADFAQLPRISKNQIPSNPPDFFRPAHFGK
jgi:hypothetical protein